MRYHKPLVSPDARIFVALIFSLGKTDFKSRPFRARAHHSKCLQSMKQSRDFHSPNATGLHESLSHRRRKITWNPIFGLLKIFVCFFNRQHNFFFSSCPFCWSIRTRNNATKQLNNRQHRKQLKNSVVRMYTSHALALWRTIHDVI